jgi:D-alanyl-D-alanine carboxypeptidase
MPASPCFFMRRMGLVGALACLLVFSWATQPCLAESRSSKKPVPGHKTAKHKIAKKATKGGLEKSRKAGSKLEKSRGKVKPVQERVKRPSRIVQAKAFYCVDVAKDKILFSRNADQQLPVASLTKLVTALVTLDHMAPDRVLTVPDHIKKVPKSVVGLKAGDSLTVDELLHGLLIGSGNDCAETLACAFPGGKERFVDAMNRKARKIGTTNTVFYTPSGLDRKATSGAEDKDAVDVDSNASTAREIALLAKVAFSNPKIRTICRKRAHILVSKVNKNGYAVRNTNKLLRDNLPVVGGKTGYTCRAGHCLATELAPGNDLFLIVVLGSPDHFQDTRLVYRKALTETGKVQTSTPASGMNPKRMASQPLW